MKFLKQLFCNHKISITSESSMYNSAFAVKSLIQCEKCGKTFPQDPSSQCCYVNHVHSDLMVKYWLHGLHEVPNEIKVQPNEVNEKS